MQTVQGRSIHERIFNEKTVARAKSMYNKQIDLELESLKSTSNQIERLVIEHRLKKLSYNVKQLEGLVVVKSLPNHNIKERVYTKENVERARSLCKGYADIYLDIYSNALAEGIERKDDADKALAELQALSTNLNQLDEIERTMVSN